MAIYFVVALIGAIWCATVASNKNLNVLGYTLLGFFFPLIGVIIVHCTAAQPQPHREEAAAP